MSIRNCPECGRIFEFVFNDLCPECFKNEENESEAIVNYLKDNPGAGISEISQATGIGADKIIKMLKSGRLINVCEQHDIKLLTCERCGKPIANGSFCLQCRDSMTRVLIQGTRESSKYPGEKHDAVRDAKRETGKSNLFTAHFKK